MSDPHRRETVGFLCRWLLLAGAGAVLAAVAWGGLRATASVPSDLEAGLLLRDWVALPAPADDEGAYLRGCLQPPRSTPGLDIGLLIAAGHGLGLVRTANGGCGMVLDNPQAGTIRLRVRGVPYSAVAFQMRRCRLLCVRGDRPLFLVDARMVLSACRRQGKSWRRCLGAMKAAGQVALFHPGPGEEFLSCRRELRAMGVGEPILFDDRRPEATETLRRVRAELRGRGQRRQQHIEVVTADATLARAAAKKRFLTHLVAEEPAGLASGGPVRLHRSLAKLEDFLSP